MKIYVQSRGYDQDKDYCWVEAIADGTVKQEIPPLSKPAISLLETSVPSVVLERLPDEHLLLLITGLEPEDRLDIINRQIRIDLAFVAPDSDENEFRLRQLAARALIEEPRQLLTAEVGEAVELLKNPDFLQLDPEDLERVKVAFKQSDLQYKELANEINLSEETVRNFYEGKPVLYPEFIQLDNKLQLGLTRAKEIYLPPGDRSSPEEETIYTKFVDRGFYVSFSKLTAAVSGDRYGESISSEAPDLTKKVGSNSPELRRQLAEEIMRCQLPSDIAPLVVVTGFKNMETLAKAKIWRGLSKLVETDRWIEVSANQTPDRVSLSMLIEIVSGWLKFISEFISNIDRVKNTKDKND